jgi:hypothetical protein
MFTTRCKNCLLPENYPNESFSEERLCSFCRGKREFGVQQDQAIQQQIKNKDRLAEEFKEKMRDVKGKHSYDCLVPLSGGKDSAYLAYLLKNTYDLHILGLTIDNGFLGPLAKQNVEAIVEALDIDHIFFTPHDGFFKKIYGYNLQHPKFHQDSYEEIGFLSTVCHACTDAMHSIMVEYAFRYEIPAVALAYAPDQIEYHFYQVSDEYLREHSWYPRGMETDTFADEDRRILWDPSHHQLNKNSVVPTVFFPFHVLPYPGSNEIQETLHEKDILKKGKGHPVKTNCRLNYLLVYLDIIKLGYNPLTPGISYQIRQGLYNKRDWFLFFIGIEFLVKTGIYRNILMKKPFDVMLKQLQLRMEDIL